jgi:Aminoglycoside-2''-adenylyltransferase
MWSAWIPTPRASRWLRSMAASGRRVVTSISSSRAARQLSLIRDVVVRLDSVDVRCWLSGGWALDFALGRITRSHDDVDMVIFTGDCRQAEDVLGAAGYRRVTTPHPAEHRQFVKYAERVSLTFVEYDEAGRLVTPVCAISEIRVL